MEKWEKRRLEVARDLQALEHVGREPGDLVEVIDRS